MRQGMSYKEYLLRNSEKDCMSTWIWWLTNYDKAYQRLRSVKSKQQYAIRNFPLRFINNAWM